MIESRLVIIRWNERHFRVPLSGFYHCICNCDCIWFPLCSPETWMETHISSLIVRPSNFNDSEPDERQSMEYSTIISAKKRYTIWEKDIRLVIDYKKLNSVTQPISYPIPLIDEMIDRIFTTLDLQSANHHQIPTQNHIIQIIYSLFARR